MIQSARADCEKICVLMKVLFRRNTLCIARKSDKIKAQIFRQTPQAIDSAFTKGFCEGTIPQVGQAVNHYTAVSEPLRRARSLTDMLLDYASVDGSGRIQLEASSAR